MARVNGARTIALITVIALRHEFRALRHDPEQLITRVFHRLQNTHPLVTRTFVIYLAGHLLDAWPHDPLDAHTWHRIQAWLS